MDGLCGEESAEIIVVAANEPGVVPMGAKHPEASAATKDRTQGVEPSGGSCERSCGIIHEEPCSTGEPLWASYIDDDQVSRL